MVKFEEELQFFIANQNDLVAKYRGKILVLKGESVVATFDTFAEAFETICRQNLLGEVMLQRCLPGIEAYTVHSPFVQCVLFDREMV